MTPLKTILWAEDEEDQARLMQIALRRTNCEANFRRVPNGEEVIRYLRGVDPYADRTLNPFPCLVLLDLEMPLVGGFEVLNWVRNNPETRQLAVAVLSGSSEEMDITRAYAGFANSYLMKPPTLDALVRMIAAIRAFWIEQNLVGPGHGHGSCRRASE